MIKKILFFYIVIAVLLTSQLFAQWKTFRNGYQNQGNYSDFFIKGVNKKQIWSFQAGGLIWSTPVIDKNGNVYVGSANKTFFALSPDGRKLWDYQLEDRPDSLVDSAALLMEDRVIVPGGDGILHTLDKNSGKLIWKFSAYHASTSQGSVVNSFEGNVVEDQQGRIYAGSDNGVLYSVDKNGKERWHFSTGQFIWSAPAFFQKSSWLVFGSLTKNIYLLNRDNGELLARIELDGEVKSAPMLDPDQNIYVTTSGGSLYKLTAKSDGKSTSLKILWRFRCGGENYASPSWYNGNIFFGSHDGYFYSINSEGKLNWKFNTYNRISASAAIDRDGTIYFGNRNGKLYALNSSSGERVWSLQVTSGLSKLNLDASPALSPDGRVVVASYNGNIYSIPIKYCATVNDPRCESGGVEDLPNYLKNLNPKESQQLLQQRRDGQWISAQVVPLYSHQYLNFRWVNFANGIYQDDSRISPYFLSVQIEPVHPILWNVSADRKYLNIIPQAPWKSGVNYRLIMNGYYFDKESPLIDLLKISFLPKWSITKSLKIENETSLPSNFKLNDQWLVEHFALLQPEAAETLVPAALDGQHFVFAVEKVMGQHTYEFSAKPVSVRGDKIIPLGDEDRNFHLIGQLEGKSLFFRSSAFKMAAMGGTMTFSETFASARVTDTQDWQDATFFASIPCYKIKSNNETYIPSINVVVDLCDWQLRLNAVGIFTGRKLSPSEKIR